MEGRNLGAYEVVVGCKTVESFTDFLLMRIIRSYTCINANASYYQNKIE